MVAFSLSRWPHPCSLLHACDFINPKMKSYEIAGWKAASVWDRSGRFTGSQRDKRAGVLSVLTQIRLSGLSGINRLLLTPNRRSVRVELLQERMTASQAVITHGVEAGSFSLSSEGRLISLMKNCRKTRLESKRSFPPMRLDPRGGLRPSHLTSVKSLMTSFI